MSLKPVTRSNTTQIASNCNGTFFSSTIRYFFLCESQSYFTCYTKVIHAIEIWFENCDGQKATVNFLMPVLIQTVFFVVCYSCITFW